MKCTPGAEREELQGKNPDTGGYKGGGEPPLDEVGMGVTGETRSEGFPRTFLCFLSFWGKKGSA